MSEFVTVERRENVAWLGLAAPRSNALTPSFSAELAEAIRAASADDSCAVIAILSRSTNFCTGADTGLLDDVAHDALADHSYTALGTIYELFCVMQDSPIPIVAGVGGKVLGAGINLALACDLRVAAADLDVRGFGVAGVHPGGGHLRMLDRQLAPSWPAAVALFGQQINAGNAVTSGFALQCVERAKLEDAMANIAAAVGTDPALVRKVTATYRATQQAPLSAQGAVLLERSSQLWSLRRRP
jgi:enoyl-CoA hydratase